MRLLDFITREGVALDLEVSSREAALKAMVGLLGLGDAESAELLSLLERREDLSSTGVGRGIAIPHCRTPRVSAIRLAYGRVPDGIAWNAIDGEPVHHLFLIVAPQGGTSGGYLPLLSRLARFAQSPEMAKQLDGVDRPDEFLGLLEAKGY